METVQRFSIPRSWKRMGLALARNTQSFGFGSMVMGDPCIVWDEEISGWRMFLFALFPGHGQAVCCGNDADLTRWKFEGPLKFSNPKALLGESAYKPFVIMDPIRPNRASRVNGQYGLLVVVNHKAKIIQRAWAESLSGPWTLEEKALIPLGEGADFDAKHVDAVTGYYFEDRNEILYFYMGYPKQAQPRSLSPYGSAQAVAVENLGEGKIKKLGQILPPCEKQGHWASGWVGGLQILPGRESCWIGVVNASPTPPDPNDSKISKEEPPPSLAGFAYCDEEWPVSGWRWTEEPIERIEDVPAEAVQAGECVNFWRQHILILPDGRQTLFYNSGEYFKEQIYFKLEEG